MEDALVQYIACRLSIKADALEVRRGLVPFASFSFDTKPHGKKTTENTTDINFPDSTRDYFDNYNGCEVNYRKYHGSEIFLTRPATFSKTGTTARSTVFAAGLTTEINTDHNSHNRARC